MDVITWMVILMSIVISGGKIGRYVLEIPHCSIYLRHKPDLIKHMCS